MTKKDIAFKVAQELGEKQTRVKKIIQKTLDVMAEALEKGERIEIRNFGVFQVKMRKPRMGRNPRANVPVPVPARKIVTFKPSFYFKQNLK